MTRKAVFLWVIFLLMLSLTSCGNSNGMKNTDISDNIRRPAHSILPIIKNGETASVPATLYEGSHYSIYIPDDSWIVQSQDDDGGKWVSCTEINTAVEVATYVGQLPDEIYESIVLTHEGYDFEELDDSLHFAGYDDFVESNVEVWMAQANDYTILLWTEYAYGADDAKAEIEAIASHAELSTNANAIAVKTAYVG